MLSKLSIKSEPTGGEDQYSVAPITGGKCDVARIIFIVFLIVSFSVDTLEGQRNSDIGIFAGTSYYLGDINPVTHFYSPQLAIGPLYRYNFNPRTAVRITGIYHQLYASAGDFNNPELIARQASFDGSYVDLAAMYEFNFRPYKTANRRMPYSLYLTGGLGYHLVLSSSVPAQSHFTLPFGLGFKFNAGRKLSAGIEWTARKTFYDGLDGIENKMPENKNPLFGNKDWFNFAGVFITYKLFNYREDCPTYE